MTNMSHLSIVPTNIQPPEVEHSNTLPIPIELIERILTFCRPRDVASFSSSCRLAHAVVYNPSDQYLWRELFIAHPFDNPCKTTHDSFDWMHEMIQRMKAEWAAYNVQASMYQKISAFETFMSAVRNAPPVVQDNIQHSHDIQWVEDILRRSGILDFNDAPLFESGLHAQFRSYVTLSFDTHRDEKIGLRLKERRNKSRSVVYDIHNYTKKNWGPYLNDGRADWVHIENLINVIVMNLHDLPGPWARIRPHVGLEATRSYSAPSSWESPNRDWARVEGTWRRYVFFMDYRDLFAFNYSERSGDPSFFEYPRFREATRLTEVKLRLVLPDHSHFGYTEDCTSLNETKSTINNTYPPLYFSGSSKGIKGYEAAIEGVVRMGGEGVVRWHFASVYSGNGRWSSDGAQIGGIASALGIVGVWTTTYSDEGDPVGPFWMWKVEDDYPTQLMEYGM